MLEAISDWSADVPVTLDIATLPDKLGTGLELTVQLMHTLIREKKKLQKAALGLLSREPLRSFRSWLATLIKLALSLWPNS
jgi:hypothetical protein